MIPQDALAEVKAEMKEKEDEERRRRRRSKQDDKSTKSRDSTSRRTRSEKQASKSKKERVKPRIADLTESIGEEIVVDNSTERTEQVEMWQIEPA